LVSGTWQQDSPSAQLVVPQLIRPRTTAVHFPAMQAPTIAWPGSAMLLPSSALCIGGQPQNKKG
jgi:hypothetical protein